MKILLILIAMLSFSNVYALNSNEITYEKKEIKLVNCQSATTSWISLNDEILRIRLIGYDPADGNLNKEIDNYTCDLLKNAKKIEIQFDTNSQPKDNYNRYLVWVYIDDKLLQENLIAKGYGQVNYITSKISNLDHLCEIQKSAIEKRKGIWNYDGIKEIYCKSGIDLSKKKSDKENKKEKKETYDTKSLKYIVFLNSGIVLLVIYLAYKRK